VLSELVEPGETRKNGECSDEAGDSGVIQPVESGRTEIKPRVAPEWNDDDLDYTVRNQPWVKLVEDCTDLYSEIIDRLECYDESQLELAHHILNRLVEILERNRVEIVARDEVFDQMRHIPAEKSWQVLPGARILETVSPGFIIGPRVLRKAVVKVDMSARPSNYSEERKEDYHDRSKEFL